MALTYLEIDEEELEKCRWIEKYNDKFMANCKVEFHILSVLLSQKINKNEAYNSIKELYEKLIELH